ncbi:hypothetical protein [Aquimarina sediminis]|uniref:hypothetical protein n=1 Tax=Aquimarina sediminis TaxID=2070536 RepID=UPI000FFF5F87|nr:hypothetical protein [Aquimarina sediminis]
MKKKRKFWTNEKLLSISALFVSLVTLIVFIYQTNLIRQQQHMSVYPHLILTNYRSGSINYQYVLKNEGIGPAFVKSVIVKDVAGKSYHSISHYVDSKLQLKDSISYYYSDIYQGRVIPANEEIVLFELFDKKETTLQGIPKNTIMGAKKLRHVLNNDSLKITIEYESVYGARWSISKHSQTPVKK